MSESDDTTAEDDVDIRETIDRAGSGAPASGFAVGDRFSSGEIFQRVLATADVEIATGMRELLFSALAAGFAITLTFLGHAVLSAYSPKNEAIAAFLYPIGFIYIILGRYQLYTENTLPPVTLVLTRLASLPLLFRIWGIVLFGNIIGAGLGAFVLANSHVLSPEAMRAGAKFAKHGLELAWWDVFLRALFAGWLVAGVVWITHAARDTISRIFIVYIAFYTISATEIYHVVTTACDSLYYVFFTGASLFTVFAEFWFPVFLGNTIGGVFLVTIVNYGQAERQRFPEVRELSMDEWLFSWSGGRDRVPATEEIVLPGTEDREEETN
jgi:formate/nitrite transporter FocA (FNT family)